MKICAMVIRWFINKIIYKHKTTKGNKFSDSEK